MAIFKNPNSPVQPKAGVYGWFAEKDDGTRIPIYIGIAGQKKSSISKGTLFRGVSELQRNTFTSNSPLYNKLDTDFIVGTAIRFFEGKGYRCVWEHLNDDPSRELAIVASKKPVLQDIGSARIKDRFRISKEENRYCQMRKSEEGVREAETEIFSALERLIC
jgi:hypothetical protein